MLKAALIFFVLALVSFALGATGLAGLSMDIAKILVGVFVVLAIISLVGNLIGGSSKRL